MPTDVRTPELVINKLTKQQYESIQNPSDTEIYLVPEDEEHKPICYSTTASEVGTTSMVVKSSVSDNGKIITERGFVYDTSPSPVITGNKLICDVGSGMMDGKLDNLTQNTEYHIRSYGINGSGVNYGSELVQRTYYNPIPVEYQLVEYLQGNNSSAYINTNIIAVDNISWELSFNSNSQNSAQNGTGVGNNSNRFIITIVNGVFHVGVGNDITTSLMSDGNNHVIKISAYTNNYYIDGEFVGNFLGTFDSSVYPITLFARNQGTLGGFNKFKIINSKIFRNDITIQDLYPVYHIADNKPGMYDIVNNVFYTNQGTGEFTVGPDKEWDE